MLGKGRKDALDIVGSANGNRVHLQSKTWCQRPRLFELRPGDRIVWIEEHSYPSGARCDLFQKRKSLTRKALGHERQSSDVASRVCQICHETHPDQIAAHGNDRDRARGAFSCERHLGPVRD